MYRKVAIGFLVFICCCLQPVFTQNNFSGKTDSLLQYLFDNDRFSGSLMVAKGNSVVYKNQYNVQPLTTERYAIGSVSKIFTAVIIYQLAAEGKLKLSEPLSDFFPRIPNAHQITLYQMLGHTSGIHDIVNDGGFEEIRTQTFTREQIVERISAFEPAFKPGKSVDYSNSNFILLGFIIEDVTGQNYADAVHSRITEPLHLQNTFAKTGEQKMQIADACFYFNGADWIEMKDLTDPGISIGAGNIVSSPGDLCHFMPGIFNAEVMPQTMLDTMLHITGRSYGHGMFYAPFYAHTGFGHTGHIDEYYTSVVYFPDDSLAVALCLNGLNYDMNEILSDVIACYFNMPFNFPVISRVALSDAALSSFTGYYRLKLLHCIPMVKIRVDAANGVLFTATAKDFEQEKLIAEPIGNNTFKNYSYDSELSFIYKKSGAVKGCTLRQGDRTLYCRKLH